MTGVWKTIPRVVTRQVDEIVDIKEGASFLFS